MFLVRATIRAILPVLDFAHSRAANPGMANHHCA